MNEQQHLSRRHLFRGAAGTAMAASLLGSKSVHGWNEDHEECSVDSAFFGPKPIPGGGAPFKPLGIFVHHNPLNPALALADISDPSQITDFDGFVGLTNIHGQGTGTDAAGMQTQLAFRADMGFSKGKFIGTDGRLHKATLAFVWLDLYNAPVEANFAISTQIHDYNVHIDRNDVFWMIRVSDDNVQVDFDNQRARLCVHDLDVFDDHDLANSLTQGLGIPAAPISQPGVFPVRAKVSFDVEWNGALAMAQIENMPQNFKGTFLSTNATISWSVEQPGFRFQSEQPPVPGRNLISVLGREQNGVFFT